ncbi:MAG: hypothetical protein ACRD0Q_09595 [Acidimicrobiales bacterium]
MGQVRLRSLAVAVGVAVLAGACGGGGSGGGSGKASSATTVAGGDQGPAGSLPTGASGGPCRLLTEGDVGTAVGTTVRQAGSTASGQATSCVFALSSAPDQIVLVVANREGGVPGFEAAKAGGPVEPISGLGDRAFVSGGKVIVLRGSTLLMVLVGLRQPSTTLSRVARELAQVAVKRL